MTVTEGEKIEGNKLTWQSAPLDYMRCVCFGASFKVLLRSYTKRLRETSCRTFFELFLISETTKMWQINKNEICFLPVE